MSISEDLCVFCSLAPFLDHEALSVQFEVTELKPKDKSAYQTKYQKYRSCETIGDVEARFLILSKVSTMYRAIL